MRLPNLIIAGINKSGTTSIYRYLADHPECCGSKIKETCFYLGKNDEVSGYEKYFEDCNDEKVVFEATPGYFYCGDTIAYKIKKQIKEVKIIIALRNPTDRLYSYYKSLCKKKIS